MNRRSGVVAALACAVAAVGCSPGPLTAGHLQASMASTFARLWTYHEDEVGHPHPPAAALRAGATCTKGVPSDVQHGAGSDWLCQVTWLVDGPGTPVTATYTVNLSTDGCYAAEGDGPASVNGSATLVDQRGRVRVNPVHAYNGCIDTTSG